MREVKKTTVRCVKQDEGLYAVVVTYPSGKTWVVKTSPVEDQMKEFRKALLRLVARMGLEEKREGKRKEKAVPSPAELKAPRAPRKKAAKK